MAVDEESQELAAPCLDLELPVTPDRMSGENAKQDIKPAFDPGSVSGERVVLQVGAPLADADGPTQTVTDFTSYDSVAAVEGVLDVAHDMREAD